MRTTQKHTYATEDPAVLAAYRTAVADRHTFSRKLLAAAAAIGHNLGPMSHRSPDGVEEIVGLKPVPSGTIPAGWHLVECGKRLAPRTDRAGDKARAWLVQHQPPPGTDPIGVLLEHGLVPFSRITNGGKFTDVRPVVFEWDNTLWACYLTTPGAGAPAGITWPVVPVADCLAALARAEGAATAHLN